MSSAEQVRAYFEVLAPKARKPLKKLREASKGRSDFPSRTPLHRLS